MQPKCFYSFALFGFSNQVKSVFCEFFFCDLFVRNWLDGVSLKNVKKFLLKENRFSTKIEFVLTLFCVRRCPFRETMDEAAIKPSTDFKGNKLKFDLTTTFLSTRRNSWPSVAYETTLRHTTSGIFEPFDDDEDDYAANVDNVEFVPSKSPCCNGRTFDFNVRTNDFRTNVVRPFWSSPTRQSFRQNAIDVCEDSGQGRCYKNSFCRN